MASLIILVYTCKIANQFRTKILKLESSYLHNRTIFSSKDMPLKGSSNSGTKAIWKSLLDLYLILHHRMAIMDPRMGNVR